MVECQISGRALKPTAVGQPPPMLELKAGASRYFAALHAELSWAACDG